MDEEEYAILLAKHVSDAFGEQFVPAKCAMLCITILLKDCSEQMNLTKTDTLEFIRESWNFIRKE